MDLIQHVLPLGVIWQIACTGWCVNLAMLTLNCGYSLQVAQGMGLSTTQISLVIWMTFYVSICIHYDTDSVLQ